MATVKRLEFPAGTYISRAAEQLVVAANQERGRVDAQFNGTPLFAQPGDSAELVELRWEHTRMVDQLKRGVLRIEDL